MARAAFGRHGKSAAARTNAAHLVRRCQIATGGYWLLCDCRPEADRPPVLMPVAETHSQRQLSTQGLHTSACEAIQEPDVQRNWAPTGLRPSTNPLRGIGAADGLYPAPEPVTGEASKVGALPQTPPGAEPLDLNTYARFR